MISGSQGDIIKIITTRSLILEQKLKQGLTNNKPEFVKGQIEAYLEIIALLETIKIKEIE